MKKALKLFTPLLLISLFLTLPVYAAGSIVTPTVSKQEVSVININKADVKTLTQLKGIGTKKAQAIINYRKLNGEFKSLSELLKIKGIGEKFLKENKQRLSV